MNFFNDLSIKSKLVIIVLAITIFSLLVSTGIFVLNDLKIFKRDMLRNLTVLANAVGSNSRASIVFLDSESAQNILSSLKEEEQIQYAGLYDSDNNEFAIYKRSLSENYTSPTSFKEGHHFYEKHMEILLPIYLEDEVVGKIFLNADMKEFQSRTQAYLFVVGLILILTLIIAYSLTMNLQKIISKPILALAETAKSISQNPDYSVRVKYSNPDELGVLYSGFNEMLSQIERREKELVLYRNHLEGKIIECNRTSEELRKNEESTRTILDNAFDAIITMDANGLILSWNQRATSVFGLHANEVIGKKLADLIIPLQYRESHNRGLARFLATGKHEILNQQIEITALHAKGHTFPVEIAVSAIERDGSYIFTGILRDISLRKRTARELIESRERLRNLSNSLQSAREEEKGKIAREIHDELGQTLTALKFELSWIENNISSEETGILKRVHTMSELIENAVHDVQRIASELRPRILDILGLCEGLKWQAKEFQKRTGIHCKLTIQPKNIEVDPERSITLFRIYQETLTNVARHAQAKTVETSFIRNDKFLELEIEDDGQGMDPDQAENPNSFGLIGIKERTLVWGGEAHIQSIKGEGTKIIVSLPLTES